jgi:hypothetical protein
MKYNIFIALSLILASCSDVRITPVIQPIAYENNLKHFLDLNANASF